jgi:hypothetical protein
VSSEISLTQSYKICGAIMMGKRRSDGDTNDDDCELKMMLIDKCNLCHMNLDTDHHKNICRNDDGERKTKN